MFEDFRNFIARGNVIDLAIGVIIGAAFTAIINSLVEDMFMPIIGVMLGGVSFESLAFQVGEASINYGLFIQAVINFLLIAFILFFTIRAFAALDKDIRRHDETVNGEELETPSEVQLLMEIRDLLKENSSAVNSE